MTVFLGIDYGRAHCGLAVADGPLARPLTTIPMSDKSIVQIAEVARRNNIQEIVLGLPEGKMDEEVRQFGARLSDVTHLPVLYHPETLSTHEAIEALKASGASRAKKGNDHVYAACIILEDYLESQIRA